MSINSILIDATEAFPWVIRGQQAQAQLAEVSNVFFY